MGGRSVRNGKPGIMLTPWYAQMGVMTLMYTICHSMAMPVRDPESLRHLPNPLSKEFQYMLLAALMLTVFAWPLVLLILFFDLLKEGRLR